jgi:hypothetical protein
MNIVKTIDQYNKDYVYFCDSIKNNIINDGSFIRILYTTPNFTLNGIFILLLLHDVTSERYYNKYKYNFNTNIHNLLIENIKTVEETILTKYDCINKTPQYKIYEQMKCGNIKIFCDDIKNNNNHYFILKISGIWETELHYGLTYKFIKI